MGQVVVPAGITAATIINPVNVTGAEPRIIFTETDVIASQQIWDIDVNASVFSVRTRAAGDAAGASILSVSRTGALINDVTINSGSQPGDTLQLNGYTFDVAAVNTVGFSVADANGLITFDASGALGVLDLQGGSQTSITGNNGDVDISVFGAFFIDLNGGSVRLTTVGSGLRVAEGANAKQGLTAAMVAGTLVVANTSVTANSRILLTRQSGGTNPGAVYNAARTAGVSFTVTSTNAADTGQVAFQIFEPA